ncbi:hypothetical protein HA466_0150620 [Hirschfeldia incana]|nr:hypothetical protein HA466_0150620 [Hirschfeldia incana]KAJ0249591.1 hypothetical protein HA466_0150620 [Hirschfeldia incana]
MQSDSGKLFIGGISWDTDEERLKEYFSSFGEVIEAVILKDRTTGRARGFGFVVFADPSVAETVITEKHNIDGRLVEAKKAVPRDDQNTVTRSSNSSSLQGSPGGPIGRTRKIFVGGLPSSITESDFKTYFEQFGTTTDVVVMYDHNTQRPRGFGFITYDSEEAVEKVLLKTFHELNGKMVEVKRAVPKELSPSPARSSPLGAGYSYGVGRVNNLLNGYAQGFSPGGVVGGYGLRMMDGRFSSSPIGAGRSGFASFGGSGYGMNVNFEQAGFTGGSSFNGNMDYGRGMSPYYIGNTNRFGPVVGYEGGNGGGGGGNSSFFSSNLWGNNGGRNYNNNATNSNMGGTTSGNNTLNGPFGSSGVNWGAPGGGGGNNGVNNEDVRFGYGGNGESGFGLVGASRNIGPSKAAAPSSSFSSASAGYDAAGLSELYGNGAVYSDPTWRSSAPETEGPASFSYGIGGGGPSSDVSARSSSPGYVGSYSVNKRQPNRGIAT